LALTTPTMSSNRLYLEADDPDRSVMIEGDQVASVGSPCPEGVRRLDCQGAHIGAGLVNAHTHLYSGLAPLGMPAPSPSPENFLQILERVWWRLDRALDRASLRAATRLYVAEALLHGTTLLVDHHESPHFIAGSLDVLADACQELGMRALLCYGATERNGGRKEADQGLAECRRFIRSNQRPLVRGLVGLHASFTVSDETIRDAGALCRELETVLHVHVAEDKADTHDAERRGYAGPLERLIQLDGLAPGSVLAHGVHLSQQQVETAFREGCWLVQNPRSNKGNSVGYPAALWASHRVALGTDGYPADMVAEQAELRELSKAGGEVEIEASANRLAAGWMLAFERFGRFFGMPGRDTVADLIVVPHDSQGQPRHVIVGGRLIVEDAAFLSADLEAIRSEARDEASKLWQRMAAL
jgi:cytosine/adenosine deaminase-related metal-dependent hydrolase